MSKILKSGLHNTAIKEDRGAIVLYYSHKGERFIKSLGVKAKDKKKHEVLINNKFLQLETIVSNYFIEKNEYPTKKEVEARLNFIENSNDISYLVEEWIKNKKVCENSKASSRFRLNLLMKYDEINKINVNKLDNNFVEDFLKYMFSIKTIPTSFFHIDGVRQYRKERKISDNYIIMVLRALKSCIEYHVKLNNIKKYEINWKSIFSEVKFEKFPEESLSIDELKFLESKRDSFNITTKIKTKCPHCGSENLRKVHQRIEENNNKEQLLNSYCEDCNRFFNNKIHQKTLNKELRLKQSLDQFLFCCWTSLRYSDSVRPLKQYIEGDVLKIKPLKTIRKEKNEQIIPLMDLTKKLLEDNDYQFKSNIKNTYNLNIKTILKRFSDEMPSFKALRKERYNSNNKEVIEYIPRYMRISSHTGRRTAITNMINMGVPHNVGMTISGHTDINIYLAYYDTRPLEKKENIFDLMYKQN